MLNKIKDQVIRSTVIFLIVRGKMGLNGDDVAAPVAEKEEEAPEASAEV
jgi:hypothetical protein